MSSAPVLGSVPTFDYRDDPRQYEAWGATPPAGFHLHVPFDLYLFWQCVSQSGLKPLARSPGHYQHAKLWPWSSKAADVGSALDDGWLDSPDLLAERYTTTPWPTPCKKTGEPYSNWLVSNDGKAWKEANTHRTILSIDEAFAVYGMMLKLDAHPIANDLRRRARTQVSIVWDVPEHDNSEHPLYGCGGIRCKARIDMLVGDEPPYEEVDLKSTTIVIDPLSDFDPFWKHAARLGYHLQRAWYTWGLEVLTGVPHDSARMIGVEQNAPHTVEIYQYDPSDLIGHEDEWPEHAPRTGGARGVMFDRLYLYAACQRGEADWNQTSTNIIHTKSVPDWAGR